METEQRLSCMENAEISPENGFFDVEECGVFTDVSYPAYGRIYSHAKQFKGIRRVDTREIVGIRKSRYQVVNNITVVERFDEIVTRAGMEWRHEKTHMIRGGAKTVFEFAFPKERIEVAPTCFERKEGRDIIEMRAYLTNSFDGGTSVKLDLGFFRLVCLNGAFIGEKETAMKIPHIGDNIEDRLVAHFKRYIYGEIENTRRFTERLREGYFKEYAEALAVMDRLKKNFGEKNMGGVFEIWQALGTPLNFWGFYNCFTYVITHLVRRDIAGKLALMKRVNLEANDWLKRR